MPFISVVVATADDTGCLDSLLRQSDADTEVDHYWWLPAESGRVPATIQRLARPTPS